ncbi:MAG: hypothetical protein ACFB0G_06310 [Leptolyngbyaceae cyanobacterium]
MVGITGNGGVIRLNLDAAIKIALAIAALEQSLLPGASRMILIMFHRPELE